MPMQNLHNWEYDHGKVLEREQHHSSPNHPIPTRSGNPVKQLFQRWWNLGNLDFQKVVQTRNLGSCCKQKDSNLNGNLTSLICEQKIPFGKPAFWTIFTCRIGRKTTSEKSWNIHVFRLGTFCRKASFLEPCFSSAMALEPSLAKANDHVPLFQAWCLWHFNCKIICYNPPSLNSQIPGPHSENHTWEYNPSTLWRLFESRPVQTDYTIRWLWDSSPSIKLQVFKYTTDAFVCIL